MNLSPLSWNFFKEGVMEKNKPNVPFLQEVRYYAFLLYNHLRYVWNGPFGPQNTLKSIVLTSSHYCYNFVIWHVVHQSN